MKFLKVLRWIFLGPGQEIGIFRLIFTISTLIFIGWFLLGPVPDFLIENFPSISGLYWLLVMMGMPGVCWLMSGCKADSSGGWDERD